MATEYLRLIIEEYRSYGSYQDDDRREFLSRFGNLKLVDGEWALVWENDVEMYSVVREWVEEILTDEIITNPYLLECILRDIRWNYKALDELIEYLQDVASDIEVEEEED